MAKNSTIDIERLVRLEPLSTLSNERLDELAKLAYVERVSIGVSLFREGDLDNQTLYLLQGDVQLSSSDGSFDEVVTSRHNTAKFPLDDSQPRQVSCVALGLVEFLRIDNSVLDYMMMWDQLAVQEELLGASEAKKAQESEAKTETKAETPSSDTEDSANSSDKNSTSKEAGAKVIDDSDVKGDEALALVDKTDVVDELAIDSESSPEGAPELALEVEEKAVTEQIALTDKPVETATPIEDTVPETSEDVEPVLDAVDKSPADNAITATTEKGAWMRRMRHIMAFKNLPPANIKDLLERMESIKVKKGETIVQQGELGDTFYVLTDGQAQVTRTIELAELQAGASFGEESLVSGGERNASITMKTDGILMKLSKQDFDQLLKEPMLNRISPEDARIRSYKGDLWLDVRHASEYHHSHLRKANNMPLHEIRMRMEELDKTKNYICYCNTGRRSSAAAFILAQAGFKVSVLNGGVRVMPQDLVKG